MAYGTATLTGKYETFDGQPASGVIEIIPNSRQLIDPEGDVILSGRVKVTLDETGAFSVTLPATDDATVEPATGRQYTVVAKLRHTHLAAVTGVELATGATVDLADVASSAQVDATATRWYETDATISGDWDFTSAPTVNGSPIGTGGGGGAVDSVNGKTGAVTLSASDVGAQPAGSYATAAQGALADTALQPGEADPVGAAATAETNAKAYTNTTVGALDIPTTAADVGAEPAGTTAALDASLAPVAKSGAYSDLTAKPTIPTTAADVNALPDTTTAADIGAQPAATLDADTAARVNDTASQTRAALSATYASKGIPSPGLAALPRLSKAVRTYDDSSPTTLRLIGLGSSVGLGPSGGLDATNAVSRKVFDGVQAVFNRLGNVTLTHTNASVGGSVITSGQQTDYAAAKTTAGGSPTAVVLAYGMNDGQTAQYHAGQTFPGVYNNGKVLVEAAQADGADVIILTSPHPHTTRNPWAVPGGITVSYAGSGTEPAETTYPADSAAASVVTVTTPSGASVPASYRHLRVNAALRQLAADTGSVLIDVEPYWFDAVAQYGQDALFDAGEYVHPNLFAFQQTYHRAIADFFTGVKTAPAFAASAPAKEERLIRKANNTARASTTALADDPELQFSIGPNETWMFEAEVHYTTPGAADFRLNIAGPTGVGGRFSLVGSDLAGSTSGGGAPVITRSTVITPGNYLNAGGNGADAVARVSGLVRTGATGGTVAFQWAQEVSTGTNTIVYADSWIRATKVS